MQTNIYAYFPLLAPIILYALALLLFLKLKKPNRVLIETTGWIGIIVSLGSAAVLFINGAAQTPLIGFAELGFAMRMDALSMTMLVMIALLGFIVLKFSINYLEGDGRQHVFMGRMATTIASVELLVLSGNLGQLLIFWVITSVCLHYLLVFYRNRPQAVAAARKKFIVARLGDISLAAACVLLYFEFSTGDLQSIFNQVSGLTAMSTAVTSSTILLVIAAVLKSAQFPTHGWLIEVVETPTPVSALLHAGLLNAGPFLMVRMGYLMIESVPASMMLIIIGGFTALFASVVYLTQPSVKVALGYSSIAHMGFSLLICGFGVYTAAILHVVAHSFYKAHSFLSSGSAVDALKARKIEIPKRTGNLLRITLSIMLAMATYIGFCYLWGVNLQEDFNLMTIGAIIVMGLSQLIVHSLDTKSGFTVIMRTIFMALIVSLAFFSLEHGASLLLSTQLPLLHQPDATIIVAAITLISLYSAVVLLQLFSPRLKQTSFGYRLGIHLRNGFYANVIFDRMIGSLKNEKFKWANLAIKEEDPSEAMESIKLYRSELKHSEEFSKN